MSAKLRRAEYLEHMVEAVKLAQRYAEGMTKSDFLGDRKTQQAVGGAK